MRALAGLPTSPFSCSCLIGTLHVPDDMSDIPATPFPIRPRPSKAARPRFSIITAIFNSGEIFNRTACSLKAQRFEDFEWIVIDGGSSDNSVHLIEQHGSLVERWVSERDRGISDAWNKGLALARGDYILLLNAGDTYDPDFLDKINAHSQDDRRVICTHARLHTESGEAMGVFRSEPHKLHRAMHLAHNWCAVPRTHYEQLGGYVEIKLAMDFEWFHRYYRVHGIDGFTVIDEALGVYHLGGTSDINYAASFRWNADILIHHGTSKAVANFWRFVYTARHALRTRSIQELAG